MARLEGEQIRVRLPLPPPYPASAQASGSSSHGSRQTLDGGLAASVSLIAQVPSELPAGQILETLSGFPDGTFALC